MTDILRTSSDWLQAQRHAIATSDVTYRRGDRAVSLKATFGRTEYQQDDGYGVITREYAPYVERSHPMLVPLAAAIGMTPEQIDAAFVEAAAI